MTARVETPQSVCRFGIARGDVTPPVGIYHRMWGAALHDRSTGVHRPLTATAMVFAPREPTSDPLEEQVLIAVDHCLLWAGEMEQVLEAVCSANGLSRDQVVVAFSHTHAAGLMDAGRTDSPGGDLIPPYLKELGRILAALVGAARSGIRPVTIAYATGRCSLAAHRDFYDEATRQWVCGFNPAGPADDAVLVARVTDENARPVATVVNYACHPTTLAWQNTLISPDYTGAMRELVERETGVPCVFLQGASGEIGPREGFVGDPAVADRNGRQLGYAVLAALESLPPPLTVFEYAGPVISGATIGTWQHRPLSSEDVRRCALFRIRRWTVDLPYPEDRTGIETLEARREHWRQSEARARADGDPVRTRDGRAMVERLSRAITREACLPPGETFPYPVTLCHMGEALWLTVEGEPYQMLQTAIRNRVPRTPVMLAVLANGSRCSYLPPRDMYGKGIYQESIAVLAPGSLEELIEAIGREIADWALKPGTT